MDEELKEAADQNPLTNKIEEENSNHSQIKAKPKPDHSGKVRINYSRLWIVVYVLFRKSTVTTSIRHS